MASMTSEAVAKLVREQIGDRWNAPHAHGVDLDRCLVPPVRIRVLATVRAPGGIAQGEAFREMWLVLEEDPVSKNGYKILYDEEMDEFGLACIGPSPHAQVNYLGPYGEFLTTLEAM